ncbi:HNH endonuclease signature motif containing protein [Actinomycetospora termitidis]|uniref:DUF222 domain-containing protein n=1 Tax=Actinomycetospora termitidis TaxID=3053470 RepID=A0ABT7MCR4_9PSEU|nr:HNH endonuclease signature motif containing protein [Actinomycetospora sp. Odt1-22]MDL5158464.1 DUF222 domain-containing protein [Actinomycetospora sp. Odt1-22]
MAVEVGFAVDGWSFDDPLPAVPLGDPAGSVGQDAEAGLVAWHRRLIHDEWRVLCWIHHVARARADRVERALDPDPRAVGVPLGWSVSMAASRVELAEGALVRLPRLGEAMREGRVQESKVARFVSGLRDVTDEQASTVVDRLVEAAPRLGVWELEQRIAEAVKDVDPLGAENRRRAAVARARVTTRIAPSGAAEIHGWDLDPQMAVPAYERLAALAEEVWTRLRGAGQDVPVGRVQAQVMLRLMHGCPAGADDLAIVEYVTAELTHPSAHDTDDGPDLDDGPDDDGPDDDGPADDGPADDGPADDGPADDPDLDDGGPDDDGPQGPADGPGGEPHEPDGGPVGPGGPGGLGDGPSSSGDDRPEPDVPDLDDLARPSDDGSPSDGPRSASEPGDEPDLGSSGSPEGGGRSAARPAGGPGDESSDDDRVETGGAEARGAQAAVTDRGATSPNDTGVRGGAVRGRVDNPPGEQLELDPVEGPGDPPRSGWRPGDPPPAPPPLDEPDPRTDPPPGGRWTSRGLVFTPSVLRTTLGTVLGLSWGHGRLPQGALTGLDAHHLAWTRTCAQWRVLLYDPDGRIEHVLLLRAPHMARADPRYRRHIVELTAHTSDLDTLDPHDELIGVYAELARRARTALAAARARPPDQHPAATRAEAGHRFPGAELTRWIHARDRTCRFPMCTRPAVAAQIDHTWDHTLGGPTQADNLGALCLGDHQRKHEPATGWTAHQPRAGQFVWTSPTGTHHTLGAPRYQPLPPIPRRPYDHGLTEPSHAPRPDTPWRPRRDRHGRITDAARTTIADIDRRRRAEQGRPPSPYDGDPPF